MIWQDTPILINNRNRLSAFRDLLAWLRRAGMTNITVIDNASSYPPLFDFYGSGAMNGIILVHAGANLGPEALWLLDLHKLPSLANSRFIYSDADIVPDSQCPLDLVKKMHEIADRYAPAKVGPAIRIDNIPDCYAQKSHMRHCESDYWLRRLPDGNWQAPIDTTFAIYEGGWERWPQIKHDAHHIRLDFPYVVEHRPWYESSDNLSDEEKFYRAHVGAGFSSSCPVAEVEE